MPHTHTNQGHRDQIVSHVASAGQPGQEGRRLGGPNGEEAAGGRPKRILLAGVFGPFGVDDAYGRKENIMELFHNQVTREQGIASFRFFHRSFGLYFLAANIPGEVTVLDFPSKSQFEKEVRKGAYDIVGISFIAPNFVKAQAMAAYVRAASPKSEIILGGHGAAIEGVEQLIECDHVVKGEGIRWLREHLGADPNAPIVHPALPSTERTYIFGVPVPGKAASLLVPGVGCVNGCKFCCTTHFFGKQYTPFLSSGRQLFKTCCQIAEQRGTNEFFVMDENFLKNRERAMELMEEMERHGRYFEFQIFSSAEAILAFGLDNLVRLGVTYIWVGVESSSEQGNYAKNAGVNPRELVKELRRRGIIVLASGILCQEHHTPENIQQDIDFMVELKADFVQFMLLTPLPTTALYQDHKERGLLRTDLPYEEWHGQHLLSFRHPAFSGDRASRMLKGAFQREYEVNGSSMYRVVDTSVRGYHWLANQGELDACLSARLEGLKRRVVSWSPMLPTIARYAVNQAERERALRLESAVRRVFPLELKDRAMRVAVAGLAAAWKARCALWGDRIQPDTIRTRYPALREQRFAATIPGLTENPCPSPRPI